MPGTSVPNRRRTAATRTTCRSRCMPCRSRASRGWPSRPIETPGWTARAPLPRRISMLQPGYQRVSRRHNETAIIGNAITHQGDGQNVLYLDSHVDFAKRAFCGLEEDNIFTRSTVTQQRHRRWARVRCLRTPAKLRHLQPQGFLSAARSVGGDPALPEVKRRVSEPLSLRPQVGKTTIGQALLTALCVAERGAVTGWPPFRVL